MTRTLFVSRLHANGFAGDDPCRYYT